MNKYQRAFQFLKRPRKYLKETEQIDVLHLYQDSNQRS